MKRNKQELDAILDRTLDGIRREQIDDAKLGDATSRVWARVSAQSPSAQDAQAASAVADQQRKLDALLARFGEIRNSDVRALDDQLRRAGLPILTAAR